MTQRDQQEYSEPHIHISGGLENEGLSLQRPGYISVKKTYFKLAIIPYALGLLLIIFFAFKLSDAGQQINPPKIEPPKVEPPKVEQPKAELPKIEPPKIIPEPPKVVPPPPPSPPSPPQRPYTPRVQSKYHSPDQNHAFQKQHKGHQNIVFDYPTVGMPTPGVPFNFTQMEHKDYYAYQKAATQALFKTYNDTDCVARRYGASNDDGYVLCQNLVSNSVALVNLGVGTVDIFGCSFSTLYNIPNYQYDCTIEIQQKCATNNGLNKYGNYCVGAVSQNTSYFNFLSMKDIIDSNGLKEKHIIMKIDIQGSQFPGFRNLPLDYLEYIDQIVIQIHFEMGQFREKHDPGYAYAKYFANLDILKTLAKYFVNIQLHFNNYTCHNRFYTEDGPWYYLAGFCYELTLINKKLIKINKQTRSMKPHPLSTINFPQAGPDCQMDD